MTVGEKLEATIVGEVVKAAVNDPNIKEAGKNLSQTVLTITKAINNVLLPIAAMNFAFEKARIYFGEDFQLDITEKTAKIPADQVVEPKASVTGPILQGLAFSHEEPNLKEMYLNLLATAMDGRVASKAHPAFVEIIKQISSEEALLLKKVVQSDGPVPIIRLQEVLQEGYIVLLTHLINLHHVGRTNIFVENPQLPAMVDNWIRLGLVEVSYDEFLLGSEIYSWAEKRPEYIRLKESYEKNGKKVGFTKGQMKRTDFGKQFACAVGIV